MGLDERGEVNDGGGEGWIGCVGEDGEASDARGRGGGAGLVEEPDCHPYQNLLCRKRWGLQAEKNRPGPLLGEGWLTNYCSARIKPWAYSGRDAEAAPTTAPSSYL